MYFSGQGKVYLARRSPGGSPKALFWLGNVPDLKLAPTVDKIEHQESYTGQRLTDDVLITKKTSKLSMTLEDFQAENLALAIQANLVVTVAGEVAVGSPELHGAASGDEMLEDGDSILTRYKNISDLVIKDSTGSPVTLVLNTDYEIVSAAGGQIRLLDTSGHTQPYKLSYDYAAQRSFGMFTLPADTEYWLHFDGKNTADGDKACVVDFSKVRFDPTKELPFIANEYNKFELEGDALIDATKPSDAVLGQFGSITLVD